MSRSHMDMSNNAEGYSFPSSPLVVDENHPCSSPCKAKFLTGNSAVKPNSKDAAFPPTKAEPVGAARFRNTIEIRTRIDGHNSGRVYHLKAESEDECLRAGLRLSELASEARRRTEARTRLEEIQASCRAVYLSQPVQGCIALLIVAVRNSLRYHFCYDWYQDSP